MSETLCTVCASCLALMLVASLVATAWRAVHRAKAAHALLDVMRRHVAELQTMTGRGEQIRRALALGVPAEYVETMFADYHSARVEMDARHDEEMATAEGVYRGYGGSAAPK